MAGKPKPPTRSAASPDDVRVALAALTAPQLKRLGAMRRFAGLGLKTAAEDGGDLLQEAITRVLSGDRIWPKDEVEFLPFLVGVMRSIVSHVPSDSLVDVDPNSVSTQMGHARYVDPESQLIKNERANAGAEKIAAVREHFAADTEALLVLDAWAEGTSPADIRAALDLSVQSYDAIRKRIMRFALSLREASR